MAMILVNIPTVLRKITKGADLIPAWGNTVAEVIDNIDTVYGSIKERIYDKNGHVRRYINIYVNEDNILNLDNEQTPVGAGDTIFIMPAMSGG